MPAYIGFESYYKQAQATRILLDRIEVTAHTALEPNQQPR